MGDLNENDFWPTFGQKPSAIQINEENIQSLLHKKQMTTTDQKPIGFDLSEETYKIL
ncbi:MAG: hypothetical protein MHPSP_003778, partial [Paramarteilia canceri]